MRQKLVRYVPNPLAGEISSIQVGANVGVAFYTSYNFTGDGNATLASINDLSSTSKYHDKIMSFIIFPKEWLYPMGALLVRKDQVPPIGQFFPAAEKMTDRIAYYPDIGYAFEDHTQDLFVRPDIMNHPVHNQVLVKLCEDKNFGGKCLTFPGPGGSASHYFQLYNYQFSDKVSSLQVIHNSPVQAQKQPIQTQPIQRPAYPIPMQRR